MATLKQSSYNRDENEEEEEESYIQEDSVIEWSNLIFLPFHPAFKIIVLLSVVVKSTLGPIQSIYPVVYCWNVMDLNPYLSLVKFFYCYCCDYIYGIDTLLRIVHRQVTDKAMRREHLPKPAFLLLLDIVSLIPFFQLAVSDVCPLVQLWPNILAFNEFVIIYRVVEYFSLLTTHSFWHILTGFTLMLGSCINCAACFWILQTRHGLCHHCNDAIYDWRNYVMHKLNETNEGFATYIYGASYVLSFAINIAFDETKPSTLSEFIVICMLMVFAYLIQIYIILPKLFAEAVLRFRKVYTYYQNVKILVKETQRRNTTPNAYVNVESFYKLMWRKRCGITFVPDMFSSLPRYLCIDIKQDLVWSIFYHSPTLRKTSKSFKRWLCGFIRLEYKLPDEKFFVGLHCQSNLYYIKCGVVQILSTDDGVTPVLSVSGGTLFGDINFLIPPLRRKAVVRCLTYCEAYRITRYDLLKAIHRHPEDRRKIIQASNEKIEHARTLKGLKKANKDLDRSEAEGIAWIKRRWWEISKHITAWKRKSLKNNLVKLEISSEEADYHCAKYIGQLVICTDSQLETKSMFSNVNFPCILMPNSSFGVIWHRIVISTVLMVLILYPPYLTSSGIPILFKFFQFWTDLIYVTDILVSLLTSLPEHENIITNIVTIIFARCKNRYFILDLLSTVWIEELTVVVGKQEFYHVAQLNRLIKVYIFFTGDFLHWNIKKNPIVNVCCKIGFIQFCFIYIMSYMMYLFDRHIENITTNYFFGESFCKLNTTNRDCDPGYGGVFTIPISWTFEMVFYEYLPRRLIDIYFAMVLAVLYFMAYIFCQSRFIAIIYLKYRDSTNYQYFVASLTQYYKHHMIHIDLMRRLNRYLFCHWKYYFGKDVMQPDILKNEPYDIFWKVHGEVAEKVISQSRVFQGADPALIKELACATKLLILPRNSALLLFGGQCKNVTWIVSGHIKCDYYNNEGELIQTIYDPGHLLSANSVFLGNPSLRTYTACTECEILYIKIHDFFRILKHYPNEWMNFKGCIREFAPVFDKLCQRYLKANRDYQSKLRERVFHTQRSTVLINKYLTKSHFGVNIGWSVPDSKFMKSWLLFRAIIVFVSIACASLQGGAGVRHRWSLSVVGYFCDCIAFMDIIVKLFLAYYDDKGILITDKRKCLFHYLTRSFILDTIGALPWIEAISSIISKHINVNNKMLITTVSKFAHLYILFGYFGYISDAPNINMAYIMIIKWQVILILTMLGGSHYLMSYCVSYEFDAGMNMMQAKSLNTCWLPKFFTLYDEPTSDQLHFLVAQSFNLVQCGFVRINFGRFYINRVDLGVGAGLVFFGFLFWFVTCYSLAMLILNSRGHTLILLGMNQLKRFLVAERVDQELIKRTLQHFRYWWVRTKGITIHHLTNERIGVVFRQDLSYYFYQKTYMALDSVLQGGDSLRRQFASVSSQLYFLPGEQIIREMDLVPHVYVVHRGKVTISENETKIITLTRGGIIGQLEGVVLRPIRISCVAEEHADLLLIPVKQFQDFISDQVRENIVKNPQAQYDFMATKEYCPENPYNTIQYILRGRKTIKLPWMKTPRDACHGNHYSKWLYLVWWFGPVLSAWIVFIMNTLPLYLMHEVTWMLIVLDILHLANLIAEFYTVELTVEDKKLVSRCMGHKQLKQWRFYADLLSLIIPLMTIATNNWAYHLARLIRLRLLYDFHMHFCINFKSKFGPVLLKLTVVGLLLHSMTCGWILVACRDKFTIEFDIPQEVNITIDYEQWSLPKDRYGGCARVTKNFNPSSLRRPSFVVPKYWQNDYVVAITYIILMHTHTSLDAVMALTLSQVYYKVVINAILYVVDIWITSAAINTVYTKYRELYQYDYNVNNLTTYLSHCDLSPSLLESVRVYTTQLWNRQRGNWLPELAANAPMCIREDLFGALYMHHLKTPPLFRQLPEYFTRQLVARFHRIVIFPGKCIVQEGDVFSCMYFIHEGEVEKWYIDKSGESKMVSLLTINGYFGFIPGLFLNTAYQYTYYARTVVDLVFLRLKDWKDLLDSYPDIKNGLYSSASQLKRDFGK